VLASYLGRYDISAPKGIWHPGYWMPLLGRDLAAVRIFVGNIAIGTLNHALYMPHQGIMSILMLLQTVTRDYRPVSSPCKWCTVVSSSSRSIRAMSPSRTPYHAVVNIKPDRYTRVIGFVAISTARPLVSPLLFRISCRLCLVVGFDLLLFRRPCLRAGAP